jgi:D-alanyl-D-alanine carboxypeptidase (penicillin-binding protein 5/6)
MVRFFVVMCLVVGALQGSQLRVNVGSKEAILMNAETGAVLFEKEAHKPTYPASITKIATALYVLEKMSHKLDCEFVAHPELLVTMHAHEKNDSNPLAKPYSLEVDGTHMGLVPNERLPLKVLLYGLMLISGNDAANVIAKHISGDIGKFVDEINLFIKEKGCKETFFMNPHGLQHYDHQTTAYDMALLTKEALKCSLFRDIVKEVNVTRPRTNKQGPRSMVQFNKLLRPGPFYYPKAIGVKTGHTKAAGYTLVAAATHEGRTLIAVSLGATDRNTRYRDTIKLFDAAFAEKKITRKVFSKAHDHFQRTVPGASGELVAELQNDFYLSYYPAEEPQVQSRIVWDQVTLPIRPGDVVGRVELVSERGVVVGVENLVAIGDVDMTLWASVASGLHAHRKMIILMLLFGNIVAFLVYFFKKSKKAV